jgi:glycosyltransferase involved in cell wall biosynthesis
VEVCVSAAVSDCGPVGVETPQPVHVVEAWPSVTVIVPVWGDRGELAATMAALAAQEYAGSFEVLVVDNGNNEALTHTTGRLASVRVVEEPTPGSYAARNAALDFAKGEVLAFTDGDCLPRPDWLAEGVRELLSDPGASFVGGDIRLFPADTRRATAAELWDCVNGLRQDLYVNEQGWAATANMLTLRSTFDRVGPFQQALQSGGDREWGQRAVSSGVAARFARRAVVDHPARASLTELHTKIRRVTRGDVDRRRTLGIPVFDVRELVGGVRPNVRSIIQRSRLVSEKWTVDRVRYVAVAQWLQYYFLFAKISHAATTSRLRRAHH